MGDPAIPGRKGGEAQAQLSTGVPLAGKRKQACPCSISDEEKREKKGKNARQAGNDFSFTRVGKRKSKSRRLLFFQRRRDGRKEGGRGRGRHHGGLSPRFSQRCSKDQRDGELFFAVEEGEGKKKKKECILLPRLDARGACQSSGCFAGGEKKGREKKGEEENQSLQIFSYLAPIGGEKRLRPELLMACILKRGGEKKKGKRAPEAPTAPCGIRAITQDRRGWR